MELLTNVLSYSLSTLGIFFMSLAIFARFLGWMAVAYQKAEAPADHDSTGGCFYTAMMVVFISISLVFFSLAAYMSGMVA